MRQIIIILLILCGTNAQAISQGEYLTRAGDCISCHTAPSDGKPYAGGDPVNSAFGAIYGSNITPDKEYGIGNYTYEDFARALRQGIAKDGRHLYPAMPYTSYAKISDEDMHAMYDYFMHEVLPVHEKPQATKLPFPFNQRWGISMWNGLFLNQTRFQLNSTQDAQWNRGAYLVESLGHCSACHSPRGIFYQEKASPHSSNYLTGQTLDYWYAPNLRQDDASGLGRWSEDDVASFLKNGHGGGTVAYGAMKGVVENSTQYLTDQDRQAIAHYLLTLADNNHNVRYDKNQPPATNELPGAGLYAGFCASCHLPNGRGKLPNAPALAGNASLLSEDATSVIRVVLEGGKGQGDSTAMPAFENKFNDWQVADTVNYIRNSWGNKAPMVTEKQVKSLREKLVKQRQLGVESRTNQPPPSSPQLSK